MNFNHIYESVLITISDEVMPNLYVLCLGVINWILHNTNGALIINVDRSVLEVESIIQS